MQDGIKAKREKETPPRNGTCLQIPLPQLYNISLYTMKPLIRCNRLSAVKASYISNNRLAQLKGKAVYTSRK